MKYNCESCNYQTENKTNWYSHKKTLKHQRNCKEEIKKLSDSEEEVKILKEQLNKKDSELELKISQKEIEYLKDKLSFQDKLIEEKEDKCVKLIEAANKLLEEKDDKIKILTIENQYHKEIINESGVIIKESVGTMSHVIKNYKDAPVLTEGNYEEIFDDKDNFAKDLVYFNKKNILDKKLGDIIINKYKKDDPTQQSLWSTDNARLNYIIKENIEVNEKNKSQIQLYKKNSEWQRDKGGRKVKQRMIDPLLTNVKKLNEDHINDNNNKILKNKIKIEKQQPVLENMIQLNEINTKIKNETLAKDINKYIVTHFSLSTK